MSNVRALARCPLFAPLPQRVLESLVPLFERRDLASGEVLHEVGDPGETFFVVHSGELELTCPDVPPRSLGPGDFGGVATLLEPGLELHTARAAVGSAVLTFDRRDLQTLWRENPSGAAFFQLALANRLIALLRHANEHLVRLCELPLDELDHDGLRAALQVVDRALDEAVEA